MRLAYDNRVYGGGVITFWRGHKMTRTYLMIVPERSAFQAHCSWKVPYHETGLDERGAPKLNDSSVAMSNCAMLAF